MQGIENDKFDLMALTKSDYDRKDTMHDWSHIRRCYIAALNVVESNPTEYDAIALVGGLILHGVIYEDGMEDRVYKYLASKGASDDLAKKMIHVAWDSQKESRPETIEGGILHDAHLLEGDKNFLITKILVTGTARGQKLDQTVNYFFKNVRNLNPLFYFQASSEEYRLRLERAIGYFTELQESI
ncbi:MAG: hypothetical protein RBT70_09610 [Alphaproteobacteria bacterium]|jgi:uncharacterized protein|nr:hypothetical protein [Alphaproteobacteria bacterium]